MQSDDLPGFAFLGYQVKVPWIPTAEWDPDNRTGVAEVCSVSDCLVKRPPEWIQHWTHNRAWSYSTREAALVTIPADDGDKYNLFAYWAALRTFIDGAWRGLRADDLFGADLPDLPAGTGPTDCDVLGFDVVCWDMGQDLTHSPLSCNLLAREVRGEPLLPRGRPGRGAPTRCGVHEGELRTWPLSRCTCGPHPAWMIGGQGSRPAARSAARSAGSAPDRVRHADAPQFAAPGGCCGTDEDTSARSRTS